MIRFELEHADPVAVRLAIAACHSALRIERSSARVAVIASEEDARTGPTPSRLVTGSSMSAASAAALVASRWIERRSRATSC
ncbi:MAG: hypothetical protein AUH85_15195 [Chloroflexi bacterium 13_1_40CM_4_68_4]|nr:MAG: hypothetical protein AUH85_15195 [Chloroflexi bacterium 13_1_40CM_4_68_4]